MDEAHRAGAGIAGEQVVEDSGNPRIIIIDDNTAIHDDFRKILCDDSEADAELDSLEVSLFGSASRQSKASRCYELSSAYQGEDGYRMVCQAIQEGRPFSTAFVDMRMPPGWDGVETIRQLWKADPDLQVLICTAFSDYSWSEIVEELGNSDQLLILRKPFDAAEVAQIAAAMTKKRKLTEASRSTVADLERTVAVKTKEIRREMKQRELAQEQLLEKERQLRESQKLEAVGMLAGGIAHEFNNLLQIILSYTQFGLDATRPGERLHEDMKCIFKAGERATSLTRQLLGFSRRKPLCCIDLDVNAVVAELVGLAKPLLGSRITLCQNLHPASAMVHADSVELQQALLNCCINSRDAMDGTGRLTLSTELVDLDEAYCRRDDVLRPGPFVRISISDTGSGMPPDVVERVFEPFFTTKEIGSGTGLGMAMVYGLVKQHQGHIEVQSEVGVGTTFRIYLPAVKDRATTPPSSQPVIDRGEDDRSSIGTILIADDEELLRQVSSRILQRAGYHVVLASDGQEAVQRVHELDDQIDLAILDVMMPNMTGREACGQIAESNPELPLLFCTGHDPEVAQNGEVPPGYPVVHKPFTAEDLLASVREILDDQRVLRHECRDVDVATT
ncbi:Blue-light-activated protein [Stieleria neptunia]|uniref:histidine kinase n=1 Tax=Stieleria neptunia TaxID=2527979 RepID=A0A518I424_9BACT|nr:response regulator [Stieleria neptunia]QDV47797.1 Blue-light-activated protein [Stieleria neptunia]